MNKAAKLIAAALALVVLGSAAWIALGPRGGDDLRVVIEVDGEVCYEAPLKDGTGIFPISTPNGGENRVHIQEDLVFMDSANCPDQTCVKQGVIPSPEELYKVSGPMFDAGCDCAILGCTELSLIGENIRDERFVQ